MTEMRYPYEIYEDEYMGWAWRCLLCPSSEVPGFNEYDRNLQRRARRHVAKEHSDVLGLIYKPRGGARWTT